MGSLNSGNFYDAGVAGPEHLPQDLAFSASAQSHRNHDHGI
jgi:hypothetical protein